MFQGIKKIIRWKKRGRPDPCTCSRSGSAFKRGAGSCICPGDTGKRRSILPSENEFKAPASGEVTVLFETGHAVSIRTESGADVIVHIGLDTVNLKGQFFITM